MPIKIKKLDTTLPDPKRGSEQAAGIDLYCSGIQQDSSCIFTLRTGVALEMPPGYVALLFVRSSIGANGLMMANGVGVIDSDYRGEIMLKVHPVKCAKFPKRGDRIAQLVVTNMDNTFEVVEELSDTERGEGGFGSSGT